MTFRQRVQSALQGELVDRPPVSFWGHFYQRESSAEDLVAATLEFQREYRWDWVKLNPRRQYHAEPWGVRWRYSGRTAEKPVLEEWPVHQASDWAAITPRPHDRGALAEQIEAVRLLREGLGPDVPMIQTLFSPLAVLREMVKEPDEVRQALRSHPELVRGALEAVTTTLTPLAKAFLDAGADGIYFATVDWASRDMLTPEEYAVWGRPYDLRVLEAARGAWFNVLHVCKRRNLLVELRDYPVSAFSWAATDPQNLSLADGLRAVPGAVMGGITHDELARQSDPEFFVTEYNRGLEQTNGRRWLAAPGCSIPPTTPAEHLHAVRDAVEATRLIPGRSR
jgi:uroporphyrinogen decarboxylase